MILQGSKLLEELSFKARIPLGHLFLGKLYMDTNQNEKTLKNLQKAETMPRDMEMDYWLGRTFAAYAGLYLKQNEYSQAKAYLTKTIEIMKKMEAKGWVDRYRAELNSEYLTG